MSSGTLAAGRRRLIEAQARRLELRLAKERGELFDSKIATAAWSSLVGAFRARVLSVPRALAEEITREAIKGPAAVEAVLMRGMRDCLATLANWQPPAATTTPNPTTRGATTP